MTDGAGTWHLAFAAWVGAALCKNRTGAQSFKGTRSPEVGKGQGKRRREQMTGRQERQGTQARTWGEAAKTAAGRQKKIKEGFFSSLPLSFHSGLPPALPGSGQGSSASLCRQETEGAGGRNHSCCRRGTRLAEGLVLGRQLDSRKVG